jgi:hypothetical protein
MHVRCMQGRNHGFKVMRQERKQGKYSNNERRLELLRQMLQCIIENLVGSMMQYFLSNDAACWRYRIAHFCNTGIRYVNGGTS